MNKPPKKLIFFLLAVLAIVFLLFEFKLIPQKLDLDKFSTGTAKLTWNASSDTTTAGYKIYYGTSPRNDDCPPGGYEKNIDAAKATSYVLEGLEAGKTYYFSVTSYNSAHKESCFSEETKKTITNSFFARFKAFF